MIAYCPIMLLDKSGGNIDSLQYVKTWDASLSIVIEGNENMKAYLWCEVMLGQGGETYLNDIASDTIYRINKKNKWVIPHILTYSFCQRLGRWKILFAFGGSYFTLLFPEMPDFVSGYDRYGYKG